MTDQTESASASDDVLRTLDAAGKFDTAWAQMCRQTAAVLRALRAENAKLREELAQRREHMRRGIEAGRPTGGEG